MSQLTDYSNMLGFLNSWSKEKLEDHLERYLSELSEHRKKSKDHSRAVDLLQRNVSGFQRRIKELESIDRRNNFILKREHILLLSNLNFTPQSDSYLGVDFKRPLGCSDHLRGIIAALRLEDTVDRWGLTEDEEQKYYDLVEELPLALEAMCKIMLTVPSWETPKLG